MKKRINIKVVGVGGSGTNTIARIFKRGLSGVDLIAINSDVQDLKKKKAPIKIRIGKKKTQGLGTGMNPELGRLAAEEQKEEIKKALKDADLVFIATGLGGGTGSGAAPVIARIARSLGALTIGVVTLPFFFEGRSRKKIAEKAKQELSQKVDSLIVIANDNLFQCLKGNTSLEKAFEFADNILFEAVKAIVDLILLPGIINVNFADIRTIIKNSGTAFFGIGKAKGETRAEEATKRALFSPLLSVSPKKAKGILFNVSGPDVSLYEIDEVANLISKNIGPETKVVFGAVQDEKLKKGEIKVTVIITGF